MTLAGGLLLGAFLLFASLWGVISTWRVAAAFKAGSAIVAWQDGPDLVVMAAPLITAAASLGWPGISVNRPLLSCVGYGLFMVLVGIGFGRGDALLLEQIAAAHGYRYCDALDVWDPHGNRNGGPALRSWGYSRTACPTTDLVIDTTPG